MSNFIPNSFQTPNIVIDELMEQLTGNEFMLYMFTFRHIYGFKENVERTHRISISMYKSGYYSKKGYHFGGVNMSKPTIIKNLKSLVKKGLLVIEAAANKKGKLYSIRFDDTSKVSLPLDVSSSKVSLPLASKETLPNKVTVLKDHQEQEKITTLPEKSGDENPTCPSIHDPRPPAVRTSVERRL